MEDISRHPAAHTQNPRLRPAPPAQCQQQVATVRPTKTGSLRRITMKKAGDFNLKGTTFMSNLARGYIKLSLKMFLLAQIQ